MERVQQERQVLLVLMELVPMPPLMLRRNLLHFLPLTMRHLKLHYLPRMTLLMTRRKMPPHLPLRPTKYDAAATLAASLAWLALSHGDAVGCGVFDDRLRASVPARTKRSQLASICDVLEAPRNAGAGDFHRVLRAVAESLPKRGMVVVFSDLLGDREGMFSGLQLLRTRGHDLALVHVLDDDEIDFRFDGPTRFEGLELPAHLACNPRALREGYLAAVESFLAEVRGRAAALRCDYALVRTGEPLDAALVRFLSRRASVAV